MDCGSCGLVLTKIIQVSIVSRILPEGIVVKALVMVYGTCGDGAWFSPHEEYVLLIELILVAESISYP